MTLSLSPLPQGEVLIEQHSITLIAPDSVASFEVTVTVEDPDGEQSSTALQIDFLAPTPLLSGLPATLEITVSGRQEFLDPFVTGGVPSEVSWSAQTVGDVDVFIDDTNRSLRVTPRDGSRAGGQVVLFASSPRKAAVETLAVTIINAPPIVTLPDPFFVTLGAPGQLLLDDLVTDDEEVGRLSWTALPLEAGLEVSINAAVRAVTLTAHAETTTNVNVVLTATDQEGAAGADTFLVTIVGIDTGEDSTLVDTTNGNSAPVVGPLAAVEVLSGGRHTLPIAAVASDDDDLTELTWSLDAGTGIDASINNGTLTIQILESFSGQTFLGLTATDSFGAQASTILTVNVSALV